MEEAHMQIKNAKVDEYLKPLISLDFPASKNGIVRKAMDHGGLDGEVIEILKALPSRTYESLDDIGNEIWRAYGRGEGVETNLPAAAPSALSDREKDLVESMADPRRGEPD
jgi:hypothetical protein